MTATTIDGALAAVMAKLEQRIASDDDVAAWEQEHAAEQRSQLLGLSGVHDVLTSAGANAIVRDRCKPTRSIELVRQWLASRRPVLVLVGDIGVGKTMAAAWALARVPGHYVTADALTRMLRADYGNPSAEYRRLVRCELLVVDELGIEASADQAAAMLYDVINNRQGRRRTIVMGNLDADTLKARYDARTIDRMREVAVVRAVRGDSLRRGEP